MMTVPHHRPGDRPGPARHAAPAVLTDLLRDELGYDGLIVTDALDMAGASATRGIPEAAVLSLAAGADLLCIGPEKPVELVRATQAAIVDAVHAGRLTRERLEEAVARIDRMLDGLGGSASTSLDDAAQLDGARRATTVEGDLPDLRGAVVVSVATAANIAIGEVPWGLTPDVVIAPGDAVPADRPVILQVRDAHRRPEIVVDAAAVVVEWGWPGPYGGQVPRICTRGYSRPGASAVTELLRKAGWDR